MILAVLPAVVRGFPHFVYVGVEVRASQVPNELGVPLSIEEREAEADVEVLRSDVRLSGVAWLDEKGGYQPAYNDQVIEEGPKVRSEREAGAAYELDVFGRVVGGCRRLTRSHWCPREAAGSA